MNLSWPALRVSVVIGLASATAVACAPTLEPEPSAADELDLTGADDLFAKPAALSFSFEGAFAEAFAAAHAGEPSGPLPGLPVRTFDERPGTITVASSAGEARAIGVVFKVRGNSSLSECTFPKLTIKLTEEGKAAAKGTPLEGHKKLKLGTHCGEDKAGQQGTVGRLRNEMATHREALAFRALEALFPETLRSRAAVVRYVDVKGTEPVEREAFIFESIEELAKRSGATDYCRTVDGVEACSPVLTDEEVDSFDPRTGMDPKRIAALVYFHAAMGNWDWSLELATDVDRGSPRVWNHDVIALTAKSFLPVAHDFDLATVVTGRARGADSKLTPTRLEASVEEQLARSIGLAKEDLAAAKALFLTRRAALESLGEDLPVDTEGRANYRAHLDAFYAVITATH